jgi:Cu/Ag efflux protein CusF
MNKTLSTLIVSAFAVVAFNASAASHAGAPMKAASEPAAKASAPAAKATAEKKEVKPAASAPAK